MNRTPDQIIADVIGFGPDDSAQWCNRKDLHKIIHAVQGEFVDQGVEQAEHISSLEQTIHKHESSSPRMEELLVRYQQWLQIVEYDPAARVAEAHIDYMLQGQYIPRPGTVVTSGFYAAAQERENASATKEASERGMAFLVHGVHVSVDNVFVLSVPDTKGPISDMRKAKEDARAALDQQRSYIELTRVMQEALTLLADVGVELGPVHAMTERIRQFLSRVAGS